METEEQDQIREWDQSIGEIPRNLWWIILIKCKWLPKLIKEIWEGLTLLVETDNQEPLHKVDTSLVAKWEEEAPTLTWVQSSTKSMPINKSLQIVICTTTVFQMATWWETLHMDLQNITASRNTFQTSQWWTWNSPPLLMETEAAQTTTIITLATCNTLPTTAICRTYLATSRSISEQIQWHLFDTFIFLDRR